MSGRRTRRRAIDAALVPSFVAAFLTHEVGALVHSIVSIVFGAVAVAHVRANWRTYRRPNRRARSIDHLTGLGVATTTITGFTLWIGGARFELGHGPISVGLVAVVVIHVIRHRRSLAALVRRRARHQPTRQTVIDRRPEEVSTTT